MASQIQQGGFQAFREEDSHTAPVALIAAKSRHLQPNQQRKTTKKAPEGAFESALYPGLKDST